MNDRARNASRTRLPILDASLIVLAGLLIWGAVHAYATQAEALRTYPEELVVKSEVSSKADLVEKLREPPQLIFYGGSRSQRFDPAHARDVTGLAAFNLAMRNARPEGAWAFAHWLLGRSPGTRLRWVWGVQSTTFSDLDLDPGLLQDDRFSWYFLDGLVRQQRALLPATAAEMPRFSPLNGRRYSPDGLLLWNSYDQDFADGLTLSESLERYVRKALKKRARLEQEDADKGGGVSRARVYFEKTIALLNEHGTTPVIVLMPMHPAVIGALHPDGGEPNQRLLAYLHGLQQTHQVKVVDLTALASFGGDPDEFYDGVHITRVNADRVIDTLAEKAGEALR